jgi:hypothetical protein
MAIISTDMQAAAPTFIKGALAGIVLLAIGGQFWPGYMLDSSARTAQAEAVQSANLSSASLLCDAYYKAAPDSAGRLATLRSNTSYVREDKDVSAAVSQSLRAFQSANIAPLPSEYRLKSDCVDELRKKPEKSALFAQ